MKDPVYEAWSELVHEVPEAEEALRKYLQDKAAREWLEIRRERSRQAALRHLRTSTREERVAEARRLAEGHRSDSAD